MTGALTERDASGNIQAAGNLPVALRRQAHRRTKLNAPPTTTAPFLLPMLLTADDVAGMLRTTRAAVYAMVERAQLPGVIRVRRRLLFDRAELLHWLDHNRAPSSEERR